MIVPIYPMFVDVVHTPFVFGPSDKPLILCAGGRHSGEMDIWLASTDKPPIKIVDAVGEYEMKSACGPWLVYDPDPGKYTLFCSVAYHKHMAEFRISCFEADLVEGPYRLVDENFLGIDAQHHSPCVLEGWMYFVEGRLGLQRRNLATGETETLEGLNLTYNVTELFKPNIFRTGPNQLCMFLSEIIDSMHYNVNIYASADGRMWEKAGALTPGTSRYSYKPYLYKGNLVRVGKYERHSDPASFEVTWFEFEKVNLSEINPIFSDYPNDYTLPEFNFNE